MSSRKEFGVTEVILRNKTDKRAITSTMDILDEYRVALEGLLALVVSSRVCVCVCVGGRDGQRKGVVQHCLIM